MPAVKRSLKIHLILPGEASQTFGFQRILDHITAGLIRIAKVKEGGVKLTMNKREPILRPMLW